MSRSIRYLLEKTIANSIHFSNEKQVLKIEYDELNQRIIRIYSLNPDKLLNHDVLLKIQSQSHKLGNKLVQEINEKIYSYQTNISETLNKIQDLYKQIEKQSNQSCNTDYLQHKASKALHDFTAPAPYSCEGNNLLSPHCGEIGSLIFGIYKTYGLSKKINEMNLCIDQVARKVCGLEKATLQEIDFELSNCRASFIEIFSSLKNDINMKKNRDIDLQQAAVKHLIKFYSAFDKVFCDLKNIAIINQIKSYDLLCESSIKQIIGNLSLDTSSHDQLIKESQTILSLQPQIIQNSKILEDIAKKSDMITLNLDSYDLFENINKYHFSYMIWSQKKDSVKDSLRLLKKIQEIGISLGRYNDIIVQYHENPASLISLESPKGFWNGLCGITRSSLEIFGQGFAEFFMGEASAARQLDKLSYDIEHLTENLPISIDDGIFYEI